MLGLPTPTPSPSSPMVPGVADTVLHSVWHGVSVALSSSPWVGVGLAAVVALGVLRVVQAVAYPSGRRDPLRLFSRPDRATILARAGGRCERHGWITGRCRATDNLQADHVIPWSRSGPTNLGNGQALCERHNRAKAATIPFAWQRRALEKRRGRYL